VFHKAVASVLCQFEAAITARPSSMHVQSRTILDDQTSSSRDRFTAGSAPNATAHGGSYADLSYAQNWFNTPHRVACGVVGLIQRYCKPRAIQKRLSSGELLIALCALPTLEFRLNEFIVHQQRSNRAVADNGQWV
jgi:hypothetical protein